jgi:RNase adapter protein RapZ
MSVYASLACRCRQRSAMLAPMHIVIISGLSGSGKSIALNMLEDAAYYCVDNLPSQLLQPLVEQLGQQGYDKVAVVIDIRGGDSLAILPQQLAALRELGLEPQFLFLDTKTETLLKRYSETRRRHPLANAHRTVSEAIAEERIRLESLAELGHHIDTSDLKPNALRDWIRQFTASGGPAGITLIFESFGFKHGVPLDAELVFDVRCLPNPHYVSTLRPLTGRDAPVVAFLEAEPDVLRMREDIARFIANWLPSYVRDQRNYLTVGVGCTGGRHRSVYLAEWLAREFGAQARVLVRHRELSELSDFSPVTSSGKA